ncbi:hypothetical protein Pmani_039738 [Petrolisthes manimaculis]|uniref:Uncharacterized protein n=1 Tax=Petrolisthes manimaculis TaxID=1843537 RepID=A0AAE1NC72_9EUCA|nr:hypothetical protein Pmani_039738 [Petrolisthes manimaculis]
MPTTNDPHSPGWIQIEVAEVAKESDVIKGWSVEFEVIKGWSVEFEVITGWSVDLAALNVPPHSAVCRPMGSGGGPDLKGKFYTEGGS